MKGENIIVFTINTINSLPEMLKNVKLDWKGNLSLMNIDIILVAWMCANWI